MPVSFDQILELARYLAALPLVDQDLILADFHARAEHEEADEDQAGQRLDVARPEG